MPAAEFKILAINPGSTSTKFGLFTNEHADKVWTLRHSDEEMARFSGRPIIEQEDYRSALIERELKKEGFALNDISAVSGRGGRLRPLASGTYRVNKLMLEELRQALCGEHASNLGAILAHAIAQSIGVDAFIVDPICVNERSEKAQLSGTALLKRDGYCHALNSKAIAKRYAREQKRPYAELRLVVAHLGGGVCISAHEGGKMVDITDAREEGPFSADRSGTVPVYELVELCFSGHYTQQQAERLVSGEGGLYSYLGTRELIEVERRIASGDAKAALVFDAMAYQITKEIGAMAAALRGRVDAVLLTGGMAHSKKLIEKLKDSVSWIAPIAVYPGEDELQALAEGALRVLRGEEEAREYGDSPMVTKDGNKEALLVHASRSR
jgi:butyrate kinase